MKTVIAFFVLMFASCNNAPGGSGAPADHIIDSVTPAPIDPVIARLDSAVRLSVLGDSARQLEILYLRTGKKKYIKQYEVVAKKHNDLLCALAPEKCR